ncbi:S-layer homology domain-containing protein [Candidatus Gracilibacteria bacterium]|nr:S-layer homology domain-containing protein [Candidatus Gracilibacteria bacterium]
MKKFFIALIISVLSTSSVFALTAFDELVEGGIVNDVADAEVRLEDKVNRAEFLKMAIELRFLNNGKNFDEEEIEFVDKFSDVGSEEWFSPYVYYAYSQKWIDGYDDGTFKPDQNVNMVEAAKILKKSLLSSQKSNYFQEDFQDFWFAPYMNLFAKYNFLPTSIESLEQELSRADTFEIIYRIKRHLQGEELRDMESVIFKVIDFDGCDFDGCSDRERIERHLMLWPSYGIYNGTIHHRENLTTNGLENVDVDSFEQISEFFGKDKNNVYYEKYLLEGADSDSFEVIEGEYAKDKDNEFKGKSII